MKRVDLIRTIEGFGCTLVRHGGKHDWYRNSTTGDLQPVPRHREIAKGTARHIIKMLRTPEVETEDDETPETEDT